jgi:hypothetical protein
VPSLMQYRLMLGVGDPAARQPQHLSDVTSVMVPNVGIGGLKPTKKPTPSGAMKLRYASA